MTGSNSWWFANAGAGSFYNGVATQSLRFNDGDSHHLTFTPSSASGQTKCTISAWVKRANLGAEHNIFHAGTASGNRGHLRFNSDNTLEWAYYNGSSWILDVNTSAVYRDTTNWYHIVARLDTTDGTADIYVNGTIQTLQTSTKPSSSQNTSFGQDVEHQIGERGYSTTGYFDGYLSQVNFINGTDLTASSFGETKEGVWIPIDTSGLTFGTNGFRLEFKQTGTSADASGIGADTSGNTNHWTSANLAADDSNMPDCPENNYATGIGDLSPSVDSQSYEQSVWSQGNLKFVATAAWNNGQSTFGFTSGKWYAECRIDALFSGSHYFRFGMKASPDRTYDEIFWIENGNAQIDATSSPYSARVGTYTTGDVIQIAVDLDSSTRAVWFGKNGTWENSATEGEIEAGTTTNAFVASNTILPIGDGHTYFLYAQGHGGTTSATWNFGQDSTFGGQETADTNTDANGHGNFHHSVPDGFLAQCSANLPEPTISPNADTQSSDHFDVQIWSGDNADSRNITSYNFQPDLAWIKNRTTAVSNVLFDSVRGVSGSINTALASDQTDIEGFGDVITTSAQFGGVSAFLSNGFTLTEGNTDDARYTNKSSNNYVGWAWKGGASATNDASSTGVGSIDSTYRANTDAGQSIVTFTGNGTSGATVKHGLTSALDMLIVKSRESSSHNWITWHKNLSSGYFINLNLTSAQISATARFTTTVPTSSVFSLGDDTSTNTDGDDYVAYCFAEVEGYSRFGLYEGVGNNDGTFVFTGFSPSLVVTKKISGTGNWYVNDSARSTYNPTSTSAGNLYWDLSNAESGNGMDFLSNGFKIRNTDSSQNTDGSNYIYLAFAKLPWKFSNAR